MPSLTKTQKTRILLWADMLESGYYSQGRERLRRGPTLEFGETLDDRRADEFSYCCLGVACDIYSAKVGGFWENGAFIADYADTGVSSPPIRSMQFMPRPVQDWFGLDYELQTILARLNDTDDASFKDIAAWLRSYVVTH
jgi:hypothetical protein